MTDNDWKDQVAGTMAWLPTQSHYSDTKLTGRCPILAIPSAKQHLRSYQDVWQSALMAKGDVGKLVETKYKTIAMYM